MTQEEAEEVGFMLWLVMIALVIALGIAILGCAGPLHQPVRVPIPRPIPVHRRAM